MASERPNEFLPWRGQLSKPDALPDQGLDDREMSWQHLAERLEKKPSRRNIAWWIAAASLLVAFFIPATHLFRTRAACRNLVSTHSVRPAHLPLPPTPTTLSAKLPYSDRLAKSSPALKPAADRASHAETLSRIPTAPRLAVTCDPPPLPDPASASAAPPWSSLSAALPVPATSAPTQAPRRPLRIAYFNEIDNPGPSPVPPSRQAAFLRIGANAADYSVNNNNPILKIDISTPNH